MKQKCAKAAYEMIKDGMIIGLGGGRTIAFLIEELKNGNKKVKAVTPSKDTMNLCVKAGIEVLPLEFVKQIDIAFDGCNEIDKNLNALKTDGGIFTREKDFEKWLPCSTPHNLPVDGCASTISQGMVSSSFHKRQVSLTHPLLPAEEERRTSPQKRQKTKKLPRETLLQNGARTYIIATDVRSAWRTSSGKHF